MSKYIYGLSGTHGTGKSTILKEAQALGIYVDTTQLSRWAQQKLGWQTLAGALENLGTMWELQHCIFAAMKARDERLHAMTAPVLVERTPADVWAYTQVWLERHQVDWKNDAYALDYLFALGEHARKYYNKVFIVPTRDAIPFVEEPNRADLASRFPVSQNIIHFVTSFQLPRHLIFSTDAKQRAAEVHENMFGAETP